MACITPPATSTPPGLETGCLLEAMSSPEEDSSSFPQPKELEEETPEPTGPSEESSKNRLIKLNRWPKEEHSMATCSSRIKTT